MYANGMSETFLYVSCVFIHLMTLLLQTTVPETLTVYNNYCKNDLLQKSIRVELS